MASTHAASSDTVKLDPSAAAVLIARGASAGVQATTADVAVDATPGGGVSPDATPGGGVSPIDAGVVALRAQGLGLTTGWATAVTTTAARRQSGESAGVTVLAEQEAENAARLGAIGPPTAAGTAVPTSS